MISDEIFIFIFGDYVKMDVIYRYDIKMGDLYFFEEIMMLRWYMVVVLVDGCVIVFGGN